MVNPSLDSQHPAQALEFSVILHAPAGSEAALPHCLQGFCQQGLAPENWEIWAYAESDSGQMRLEREERLPLRTLPADSLLDFAQRAVERAQGRYVLFFDAHHQPHPEMLSAFRKAFASCGPQMGLMGNTHVHPMQAMSVLAMATQSEQLLFSFYPLNAPHSLPLAHWRWHNLCLPREAFEGVTQRFNSPFFWGWHLAFQLWARGWRLQGAIKARACRLSALSLEEVFGPWRAACEQDLLDFVVQHPYPLADTESGMQLWTDVQPLASYEWEALQKSQLSICVPLEPDDEPSRQLAHWRQQLRRQWWGIPSQLLERERSENTPVALQEALRRFRLATRLLGSSQGDRLPELRRISRLSEIGQIEDPTSLEAISLAPADPQDILPLFLKLHEQMRPGTLLVLPSQSATAQGDRLRQAVQQLLEGNYPYVALSRSSARQIFCRLPQ